jgi:DUF4097 and DUF4098 domain-containing protein YvlB
MSCPIIIDTPKLSTLHPSLRTLPLWLGVALLASTAASAANFEQHIAADPHGQVEISNVSGDIHIVGWDKPEVAVHADLASDSQHVDVTNQQGRIEIKVRGSGSHGFFGTEHGAQLTVQVPSGSEVEASAVSADVHSQGVTGHQSLQSVSGDVQAEVASAEVKTVSGDVQLRGIGAPGRVSVSTVSGDVKLEKGTGDLEAVTVSGDLQAMLAGPAHTVNLHTTSGTLHFQGQLTHDGSLEAESVSGDVQLDVNADGGYAYEARSFSGDIDDCFGQKAEKLSGYGPGKRLAGNRGSGAARLRVKTLSGDISLCDH